MGRKLAKSVQILQETDLLTWTATQPGSLNHRAWHARGSKPVRGKPLLSNGDAGSHGGKMPPSPCQLTGMRAWASRSISLTSHPVIWKTVTRMDGTWSSDCRALGLEGWAECGLAEIQELDVGERSSEGQRVCFGETRRAGSDSFESAPPKRQEFNILGARRSTDGQSKVSGMCCPRPQWSGWR